MSERFSGDRDLRRRFQALREADARRAPAFDSVRRQAGRGSPSAMPRALRRAGAWTAAAVATAAVLAGVAVLLPRAGDPALDAAISQARELSSWSAPTDSFLVVDSLDSRLDSPASRH